MIAPSPIALSPIGRGGAGVFGSEKKLSARQAAAHSGPVVPMAIRSAVSVAAVRAPDDRFRCEPYACVLSAEACVRRQVLVGASAADRAAGGRITSGRVAVRVAGTPYRACADCADGRRVAAAISKQLKS